MKPLARLTLLPALLPLLGLLPPAREAVAPAETRVAFAPEEGLVLTKSFETKWTSTMEGLKVVLNDMPIPPEFMPRMSLDIDHESKVVIRDQYRSLREGGTAELVRGFEEISELSTTRFEMDGADDENTETEGTSKLEGTSVLFTWDEEESAHVASFDGDSGDEALLDGLVEDADLRAFLPEGAVDEGDTWEIEAQAFEHLFVPGGDLSIVNPGTQGEGMERLPLEGEIRMTFRAVHEEDGRRLAILELAAEIESFTVYSTTLEAVPVTDGVATETFTMSLDVEGTLEWDLEGGYLSSLSLSGPMELEIDTIKDVDLSGSDKTPYESTMTLAGDWSMEVGFDTGL